jgi:SAM-dependent methyltransferase
MSANAKQREYWNDRPGDAWTRHQARLDRQIRPHGLRALETAAPAAGERALDVGCGCGDTSLELARRVGAGGVVLGVDLSRAMVARARERAAEAGLRHVEFREADAQTADLGEAGFDLAFSRFGVMFFEDPVAAFANLRRALRPGGRLAFVCWQALAANPWVTVPIAALVPVLGPPPSADPDAPGPFAFGDPARVRRILEGAGFAQIGIRGEELRMTLGGGGLDDAVELFTEIGPVATLLREHPERDRLAPRVGDVLRAALAPYADHGTVAMTSAIWVVEARR